MSMLKNRKKLPWQFFAAGEGSLKTAHFFLYKWGMSGIAYAMPLAFVWTTVVGIIQTTVGLLRFGTTGKTLALPKKHLLGAMLFGVVATYITVLPAWLSSYDVVRPSLFPFMTAVGIIPGLLLDMKEGQSRNSLRAGIGIFVFLIGVGAYFEFDFTSMLGTWQLYLALTFAFAAALNEQIARHTGIGAVDPFIMQFWVGVSTIVSCAIGLLLLYSFGLFSMEILSSIAPFYWYIFILFGILIVPSIFCKVRSYEEGRGGGSIVSKKVVMLGVLLTGSLLVEWLFFGIERSLWTTIVFLIATLSSYRLLELR